MHMHTSPEPEGPATPADALRIAAELFRARGEHLSADDAEAMIAGAEETPCLYPHFARQMLERAQRPLGGVS